jgi:hypothetical protein
VKANVFAEPRRKILSGWYALCNEAAYGHYENVERGEVARMIDGIRDFIVRYLA